MAKRPAVKTASIGANGALGGNSKQQLKAYVERVERIEGERAELASDVRDILAEAKSNGFDVKTLRFAIRERKLNDQERAERDALRDTYMNALGGLADLPLGQAAVAREFSDADMPRTAMGS